MPDHEFRSNGDTVDRKNILMDWLKGLIVTKSIEKFKVNGNIFEANPMY